MTRIGVLLSLLVLSLASCGGSDDDEKKTSDSPAPQTTAQTTPQTTETITADGLVSCIEVRSEGKLRTDTSGDLSVGGLTTDQYETVAVEEDGSLVAQVLVFPSLEEADKAVGIIEKEGFWDDVRPGGNAVMLPRGGSEPSLETIQSCFPTGA